MVFAGQARGFITYKGTFCQQLLRFKVVLKVKRFGISHKILQKNLSILKFELYKA